MLIDMWIGLSLDCTQNTVPAGISTAGVNDVVTRRVKIKARKAVECTTLRKKIVDDKYSSMGYVTDNNDIMKVTCRLRREALRCVREKEEFERREILPASDSEPDGDDAEYVPSSESESESQTEDCDPDELNDLNSDNRSNCQQDPLNRLRHRDLLPSAI